MSDFFDRVTNSYNKGLHSNGLYDKAITTLGNMAAEINHGTRPSQVANRDKKNKESKENDRDL